MSYFCPAASVMVPVSVVGAWSVQLSIISCPFTQRRTPSSVMVWKVYTPPQSACTFPVQRALHLVRGILVVGELPFQLKLTVGSTCTVVGLPLSFMLLM